MAFTIVTDSAANLPRCLLNRWNITVIPFPAYVNGVEYACESPDDFDAPAYYAALREGAAFTTSQINPDRCAKALLPLVERGEEILFVGVSSGVSGSFASAMLARDMLLENHPQAVIRMVDSLSAGFGEGLIVLEAAVCRQKGMALEETAQYLEKIRTRVYHLFVVDDLMHLRRSGRISNVAAAIGSALNIKPLLKGSEEGKIVPGGKLRGRKRVLQAMADKYAALAHEASERVVGISHADCLEDAQKLAELIRERCAPRELLIAFHEPATGGHIGPGALALFFFGKDGVRFC